MYVLEPDLLKAWDREARGIPIGRPAEVNLRNNHTQYIFTWYVLYPYRKPQTLQNQRLCSLALQVCPRSSYIRHAVDGSKEASR